MSNDKMTIRPGLLVSLKTQVRGGVRYERLDLEKADSIQKWETTKVVADADELARATKARGMAQAEIVRVCSRTSFGLLCAEKYEPELDAAYRRALNIIEEFNATATHSKVHLWLLKGRVAPSDEVAARAIAEEVRELISAMGDSIERMDAAAVRDAANRARQMMAVLSEGTQESVSKAVEAARRAARDIVRRVEKKGEDADVVLAEIDRSAIDAARIAFIDMAEEQPQASEPLPAVQVQRVADLDWLNEEEV